MKKVSKDLKVSKVSKAFFGSPFDTFGTSGTFDTSRKRGFTLVEILVAVGILSTLLGATIAYINPAKQIGRVKDAKRATDLDQVKKALDLYYNDNGCYPTSVPFGQKWTAAATGRGSNTLYMEQVPQDSKYPYQYFAQPPASGSTTSCAQWYTLFAKLDAKPELATTCHLDPDAGAACVPADYGTNPTTGPFYTCKTSSSANCRANAVATNQGTSTALMCYPDSDSDGYAPRNALGVEQPTGVRACSTGSTKRQPLTTGDPPSYDCDDTSNSIKTPTKYCRDHDGDRYCDALNSSYFCPGDTTIPSDYITQSNSRGTDCDDSLADRNVLINEYRISPPVCDASSPTKSACIPPNSPESGYSLNPSGLNTLCTPDQTTGTFALSCTSAGSCSSISQYSSCTTDICPNGSPQSGSKCTTLTTDSSNCGTCGTVCGTGSYCSSGSCNCTTSGLSYCGNACVDTNSNNNNCGTCGTVCGTGTSCSSGICVAPNIKSTPGLATGLISYWKMENNVSLLDSISHNDIIGSNTTNTPGKLFGAQSFNGINSRGDLSGNINITSGGRWTTLEGSWTFQAWFKGTSSAASPTHFWLKYVVFGTNASPGFAVIGVDSGKIAYSHYPGDGTPAIVETGTRTITDGQWHHLVWANSNASLTMYVDGVADVTINSEMGPKEPISAVGSSWSNWPASASTVGYMNGALDELAYWNRKLSQTEITSLYNGGSGLKYIDFSPDTNNSIRDNLTSYWKLDETGVNTTQFADSVGTRTGSTLSTTTTTSATGIIGNARVFNTNAVWGIYFNSITVTSAQNWSISAWYKGSDVFSNTNSLVANPVVGTDSYFFVGIDGGKIAFSHYASVQFIRNVGSTNVADNTWHHLVWINNNNSMTMYVDGVPQGVFSSITSYIGFGLQNISFSKLGWNGAVGNLPAQVLKGTLDEIGFWNKALTSQEVTDLYNNRHGNTYIKATP